jgi:pimeloyl-ACP methyl ester carboxylesterase
MSRDRDRDSMTAPPRRVPWHEYVVLRGLRHRLTWWGERTERPIVLLHGWMDCSETWQFLVDCLPEAWSFVALDWRGFGGTEWPREGYWFPDYYADLDALLDAIAPVRPARVIAHSMGGNVATIYGSVRPQRLVWLVNLEGIGLRRSAPEEAPGRIVEWLDQQKNPLRERRYSSPEVLAEFLVSRNPRMPKERAEFLARAWTRVDTSDGESGFVLAFDPRHRNVNPVLYRREEWEACWRCFEAPLLLMLAEESQVRSRVGADASEEYLRSLFRNLRLVTVPQVGHMMHLEDPATIARHIVEFAESAGVAR